MARSPTIERQLEERFGDLHKLIPPMVSDVGQEETARRLRVKQAWISRWLKHNGYRAKVTYVKETA